MCILICLQLVESVENSTHGRPIRIIGDQPDRVIVLAQDGEAAPYPGALGIGSGEQYRPGITVLPEGCGPVGQP